MSLHPLLRPTRTLLLPRLAPRLAPSPRHLSTTLSASKHQPEQPPQHQSAPPASDQPPNPQPDQTTGEQKIVQILTHKFSPSQLKVQDISGGCGSFYAIGISSKHFKGLSTIKAHRLVNAELKDVIKDIHGLQLRTIAED